MTSEDVLLTTFPSPSAVTGDDQVSEIGVPSRPPPPPASAPTGLKSSDLKIAGGNVGKANAYMAAKLVRSTISNHGLSCT